MEFRTVLFGLFVGLLGLGFLAPSAAFSATVSWLGPVSGDWSDGTKWSGGLAPAAGDTVAITVGGGTYTVTVDVDPTVARIVLGGAGGTQVLSSNGQTLSVATGIVINADGRLDLSNASILGTGSLDNAGTLRLLGSASVSLNVANTGDLHAANLGNTIPTFTTQSGEIRIDGQLYNSDSELTVVNGFTNAGTIVLTKVSSTARTMSLTVPTLVNTGTISSPGGVGSRRLYCQLDNQGTLSVANADTDLEKEDADHLNSGDINVLNFGDLDINLTGAGSPSFIHSGNIDIDLGQVCTVDGGTFQFSPGTTSNTGVLEFTNCDVVGVVLSATSCIFRLAGNTTVNSLTNAGGPVEVANASNVVTTIPAQSGEIRIDGQLYNSHSELTVVNGFTNAGTIVLTKVSSTARTMSLTVPTLVNTGTISSPGGVGSRRLYCQLDNQGTLSVANADTDLEKEDADHLNSGDINVLNFGDLDINLTGAGSPSFIHSGNIDIDLGQVCTVDGGTFQFSPGTTSNTGVLEFTNCDVVGVVLSATSCIFRLAGNTTVNSLTNAGGPVEVANASNVVTTIPAQSGEIRIDGQLYNSDSELTVVNGFTNAGTIVLTKVSSTARTMSLTVPTLVNTGTISSRVVWVPVVCIANWTTRGR